MKLSVPKFMMSLTLLAKMKPAKRAVVWYYNCNLLLELVWQGTRYNDTALSASAGECEDF